MNKDSAVLVLREMNLCGLVVNRSNNKSVGQDADGISGRSLYGLMEKVFMLGTPIYLDLLMGWVEMGFMGWVLKWSVFG